MAQAGLKLIDTAFGLQVIYNGRRLYGERPLPDVERRIDSFTLQEDTLYILPSPLVCHGVATLAKRLPAGSALLAVEADPILLELSRRFWADLGTASDAQLVSTIPGDIERGVDSWGLGRFRRVRELGLTGGSSVHRETYRTVLQRLDRDIRIAWQNRLTLSAMGRLWMRNIFRNLSAAHTFSRPGITTSIGADTRPAVVCGAGPSLNSALGWIAEMGDEISVIASDTGLPTLVGAGIEPDAVVALEGQLANVSDFMPAQGGSYTLYADLTSAPAAIELHAPGQVVWLLTSFAPVAILRRLRALQLPLINLPPVGSVGVAAVLVASLLTLGPIFLSGLDMSILPGETHARGSAPHRALLAATTRVRRLGSVAVGAPLVASQSVAGQSVETTVAMLGYAEELRRVVIDLNRVYALPHGGLPTGATAVSFGDASGIVLSPRQGATGSQRNSGETSVEVRKPIADGNSLVSAFLHDEHDKLSSLRLHLEEHLSGVADRSEELPGELEELDYVAVDFPDPSSHSRLETSYLRRALIAAGYYQNRIDAAIDAARD